MKPICYQCRFREDLIGDAHSQCVNPKTRKELNIRAHECGIRNGWFNFPSNFDPVWLKNCDGYEEID